MPATIVFSHANSFPASTYRVLFKSLQTRGFTVKAVEKYGHDPRYAISNNWPNVVPELIDFAQDAVTQTGEPVWLVGHSLGGYLSLMAAIRKPELVRGVVLIDSPIVGGRPVRSAASGAIPGPASTRPTPTFATKKPLPNGTMQC